MLIQNRPQPEEFVVPPPLRPLQTTSALLRTSFWTAADLSECCVDRRQASAMFCQKCSKKFRLFDKKVYCSMCSRHLCSRCISKPSSMMVQSHQKLLCLRCVVLFGGVIVRSNLYFLSVAELRDYLNHCSISTRNCTEKQDLIDLITEYAKSAGFLSQSDCVNDHQHSEHLAELLRNNVSIAGDDREVSPETDTQVPPVTLPEENTPASSTAETQSFELSKLKNLRVESLQSPQQIAGLSVQELKYLLQNNFVSYAGCVEKCELVDRVKTLWMDRKTADSDADRNLGCDQCIICMDREINCALLECGHLVCCVDCAKVLTDCPLCRQYIVRAVRIFRP